MNATSSPDSARMIRVLLVDDSSLTLEILRRMLATAGDIEVVACASNGLEALKMALQIRPDVICTDFHLPGMDGLSLTRELMSQYPVPILVMSTSLQDGQKDNIFALLEAGAVEVLAKPLGGNQVDFGTMAQDLIRKIRILSGVKVFKRRTQSTANQAAAAPAPGRLIAPTQHPRIIGIGASTGGPQALEAILRSLPRSFPLPLICIQHIANGFMQGLVNWLAGCCQIRICSAQAGMAPEPGTAYFAIDGRHLEIGQDGRFRCSALLPVGGHRPSIDLALRSLARQYGAGAAGVLLTGMGHDGAQGLLEISSAGGFTIAQDEQSSIVFGMPKAAIDSGAARAVLPLPEIAGALLRLSARRIP